jgi:putative transposase
VFFKTVYALTRHVVRRSLALVDRDALIRELLAEIIVLRHRLQVETRGGGHRPKLHRPDRLFFATFSGVLPRWRWGAFGYSPKTLLRWHRELVAAKWTFKRKRMGRPPVDPELASLIVSMAKDSSDWGCYRVKGELQGLGFRVGVTTIRRILRRAGVPPAPRRDGPTWSEFLRSQAEGILACDLFTVETVFLRTLYVLVFIEIGSRRLRFSVSTEHPTGVFLTQQARNLYMEEEEAPNVRFLIRDRDSKYTRSFDDVFISEGARVIKTPIRAPNANAFSERSIGTTHREVTDRILILGPRHLNQMLRGFARHYNSHRPHQGIDLRAPDTIGTTPSPVPISRIQRRRVVGGLISEYYSRAA